MFRSVKIFLFLLVMVTCCNTLCARYTIREDAHQKGFDKGYILGHTIAAWNKPGRSFIARENKDGVTIEFGKIVGFLKPEDMNPQGRVYLLSRAQQFLDDYRRNSNSRHEFSDTKEKKSSNSYIFRGRFSSEGKYYSGQREYGYFELCILPDDANGDFLDPYAITYVMLTRIPGTIEDEKIREILFEQARSLISRPPF